MSHPSGYVVRVIRGLVSFTIIIGMGVLLLPAPGLGQTATSEPADTVAPDEITDLSATALDKSTIKIQWTAPGDQTPQGRKKADRYEIRYYTEKDADRGDKQGRVLQGPSPAAPGTRQSATARGLDEDMEHYFFVLAIDKAGNKQRSNVTLASTPDQTPPKKVTDLQAEAKNKSTVELRWTAPEDPSGKKVDRYELYYKEGSISKGNAASGTKVAISGAKKPGQSERYTVNGLEEDKSYGFILKAFDKAGNATFGSSASASTPDQTPPAAITDLQAEAKNKSTVELRWTAPEDPSGKKVDHYELYYKPGSISKSKTAEAKKVTLSRPKGPGKAESHTVNGLDEDKIHGFILKAFDKAGNATFSSDASVRTPDQTPPKKVTDLQAEAKNKSTVELRWTAPEDPTGKKVRGYELYYKEGSISQSNADSGTKIDIATAKAPGKVERRTVNGLEEEKTYAFILKTFDVVGNASFGTAVTITTPDQTPPAAITDLQAEARNKSTVELRWTAPEDPTGKAVAGYDVFHHTKEITKKTANKGTKLSMSRAKNPGQAENKLLTGLLENQSYWFIVRAYDPTGNESFSSVQQAKTPDETPPGPVEDFVAEPKPEGAALALRWKAPKDKDLKGIVLRIKAGARPKNPQDGDAVCDTAGEPACDGKTKHVVRGLENGKQYYISAFSYDAVPNFHKGKTTAGTPKDIQPPAAPKQVKVSAKASGEISVEWQNPTAADFNRIKILRRDDAPVEGLQDRQAKTVFEGPATSQSFTDAEPRLGVMHHYSVFALDTVGNASKAGKGKAKVSIKPVSHFTVDADPVGASLTLRWTPSPTKQVDKVKVARFDSSNCGDINSNKASRSFEKAASSEASITDSDLKNGATYCYVIAPVVGGVPGPTQKATGRPKDTTAPEGISNLAFTPKPPDKAQLRWTTPADPGSPKSKMTYSVYRAPSSFDLGGLGRAAKMAVSIPFGKPGASSSFNLSGLKERETLYLALLVTDESGNKALSNVVHFTMPDITAPGEVSNLEATVVPEGQALELSWSLPKDKDLKGVKLLTRRGQFPTTLQNGTLVCDTAGTPSCDAATRHRIDGLTNGQMQYFTLFTYDDTPNVSKGARKAAAPKDTVPPAAPTRVNAQDDDYDGVMQISWQAPDDDLSGFKVLRRTGKDPSGPFDNQSKVIFEGPANATQTEDKKTYAGSLYHYGVFALDKSGNWSRAGIAKVKAEILPVTQARFEDGLVGGKAKLSWTNSISAGVSVVRVLRWKNSCGSRNSSEINVSVKIKSRTQSWTDTNFLQNDQSYCWELITMAGNKSGLSAKVTGTPTDSTPPDAPSAPKAEAYDIPDSFNNGVRLTIQRPKEKGAEVLFSRKAGSCPTTPQGGTIVKVPAGKTTVEDTNVPDYKDYCYRAFSYDKYDNYSTQAVDVRIQPSFDDDKDGMTEAQGDCDDTRNDVYKGAPSLDCSTTDWNCDGTSWEDAGCKIEGVTCREARCVRNQGCEFDIQPDYCVIDDHCYQRGDRNPSNSCFLCTPDTSQTEWILGSEQNVCEMESKLPDSGLSTCYDNTAMISCPQRDRSFFGQDGNYLTSTSEWESHENHTATDSVTGLTWETRDRSVETLWDDARTRCESLNLDGKTWRLPNLIELTMLSQVNMESPYYQTDVFQFGVSPVFYKGGLWASDSRIGKDGHHHVFYMKDLRTSSGRVPQFTICVTGDPLPVQQYKKFGKKGVILDKATGLFWEPHNVKERVSWKDAMSYCENLRFDGAMTWHVPNYKELMTLVDTTKENPAINAEFFPKTEGADYWTATPIPGGTVPKSLVVNFLNGELMSQDRTSRYYVRCVR